MEESVQTNKTNETSLKIDVNNEKDKIDNDVSSIPKITTELCELKQINCEIGAKDVSKSCSNNSRDEDDISRDENRSYGSNESKKEDDRNDREENVAEEGDVKNSNECRALEDRSIQESVIKQKRKSRSTRRRLNAMINNTSLHFSDTDSEGELIIMDAYGRASSPAKSRGPVISVTMDDVRDGNEKIQDTNTRCLTISSTPDIHHSSRRGSYAENLTDVDEIYGSEPENEGRISLTVTGFNCQGETDVEDMSNDEDEEPIIYVTPRSDILCEFAGETITTKEGDGPFSVEIRSRMSNYTDDNELRNTSEDVIIPDTESEDMEISDEDDPQVASCSHRRDLYEDFDVLAASQIVMTNVNKTENALAVKDIQDDVNLTDCHTDVEDVD